jgi:hypothetical protein
MVPIWTNAGCNLILKATGFPEALAAPALREPISEAS